MVTFYQKLEVKNSILQPQPTEYSEKLHFSLYFLDYKKKKYVVITVVRRGKDIPIVEVTEHLLQEMEPWSAEYRAMYV